MAHPVSVVDSEEEIIIAGATSNAGDTAVAVHPEDERYRHLVVRASFATYGADIPLLLMNM